MNDCIYIDGYSIPTSDVGDAIKSYDAIFGKPNRLLELSGQVINHDYLLSSLRAELVMKDKEILEMQRQITMLFELVCDSNNISR